MNLKSLNNKKIGILGLGLENLALIKYLFKHKVECRITVCDARLGIKNKMPVGWQLGKKFNQGLEKFDILLRSPGWPIACSGIQAALRAGAELSSPMKLFFELCPTKNIIGVTGTKGKGTTASLIYEILKANGRGVWLGGNIGVAPFDFMDKIKVSDWVVLELSSFQLEDMTVSPIIAVITNFYPEHLAAADPDNPNYHKSLENYWGAKRKIAKYQTPAGYLIISSSLKFKISKLKLRARRVFYKKSNLPSKLIGEHNKENIGAAVEAAKIASVKSATIKKAVAGFKGLPHRLELVRELGGVKYYNDSFATTPESAIIALKSFNQPVVLLLGGADKGASFKALATEVKARVNFTVLLAGSSTPRIKQELLAAGFEPEKIKSAHNIKAAVKAAAEAASGGVVLLSPACASFGMFKNYKERGELFKREVKKLPSGKLLRSVK